MVYTAKGLKSCLSYAHIPLFVMKSHVYHHYLFYLGYTCSLPCTSSVKGIHIFEKNGCFYCFV